MVSKPFPIVFFEVWWWQRASLESLLSKRSSLCQVPKGKKAMSLSTLKHKTWWWLQKMTNCHLDKEAPSVVNKSLGGSTYPRWKRVCFAKQIRFIKNTAGYHPGPVAPSASEEASGVKCVSSKIADARVLPFGCWEIPLNLKVTGSSQVAKAKKKLENLSKRVQKMSTHPLILWQFALLLEMHLLAVNGKNFNFVMPKESTVTTEALLAQTKQQKHRSWRGRKCHRYFLTALKGE